MDSRLGGIILGKGLTHTSWYHNFHTERIPNLLKLHGISIGAYSFENAQTFGFPSSHAGNDLLVRPHSALV